MSIASAPPARTAKVKPDAVLAGAVDLAREAATQDAEHASHVGDHLAVAMVEERLAVHKFACTMRGYVGWEWNVTVARVPRGRVATVCEVHLLPTERSILAPSWLPWDQRLQPGDIGPGDVMPFKADDPRLVEGYTATGNLEEDQVAIEELALARARILSETGRDEAAKRWYEGDNGPRSAGSLQSAGSCGGCGFLVPLQGALGQVFGVCANVWSEDDGKVVAFGHGCGAHSETDVPHRASEWPDNNPIIDETAIETVSTEELQALAKQDAESTAQAESATPDTSDDSVVSKDSVESELTNDMTASDDSAADVAEATAPASDFSASDVADSGATSIGESQEPAATEVGGQADLSNESGDNGTEPRSASAKRGNKRARSASQRKSGERSKSDGSRQAVDETKESEAPRSSELALDLPKPVASDTPAVSREQVLQSLDLIAQSLPQRGKQ